jgi:trimethylamine--corrinoid protein Co-methyltransferase
MTVDAFGMHTDAVTADGQSQMERTMSTMLSALSGVSIIAGAGQMDHGNALDPVQLVLDNQLMMMIYRLLQGVEVDTTTAASDLIARIGPGGNFLNTDHTLTHFRSATLRPDCVNRFNRNAWKVAGQKEMRELAQQKALNLLSGPRADPLDLALKQELDIIFESYTY